MQTYLLGCGDLWALNAGIYCNVNDLEKLRDYCWSFVTGLEI